MLIESVCVCVYVCENASRKKVSRILNTWGMQDFCSHTTYATVCSMCLMQAIETICGMLLLERFVLARCEACIVWSSFKTVIVLFNSKKSS